MLYLSSTKMISIREKNKQLLANHIIWMASHKQMANLCPCTEDKRFEYDDEQYFSSFHEVVCILKTMNEDERSPVLSEIFEEISEATPYMASWYDSVKADHFEANEDSGESWPFWPVEFIYIASLDVLLKNKEFAKDFYKSDPLCYLGRCPCKFCGKRWNLEKKERGKSRVICAEPIFVNGKKYLKSRTNEIYDAFTYEMIGNSELVM